MMNRILYRLGLGSCYHFVVSWPHGSPISTLIRVQLMLEIASSWELTTTGPTGLRVFFSPATVATHAAASAGSIFNPIFERTCAGSARNLYEVLSWMVVWTPLKNIKVNWDDYSQYMEKWKSCSTNQCHILLLSNVQTQWAHDLSPGHQHSREMSPEKHGKKTALTSPFIVDFPIQHGDFPWLC